MTEELHNSRRKLQSEAFGFQESAFILYFKAYIYPLLLRLVVSKFVAPCRSPLARTPHPVSSICVISIHPCVSGHATRHDGPTFLHNKCTNRNRTVHLYVQAPFSPRAHLGHTERHVHLRGPVGASQPRPFSSLSWFDPRYVLGGSQTLLFDLPWASPFGSVRGGLEDSKPSRPHTSTGTCT